MKRATLALFAATALTASIPAVASAQSINERQNSLFSRIEAGVRSQQLTQREADQLRSDFYALMRLEDQYRASRPGLTNAERADLNRRFDQLSQRIRFERNDNDRYANWVPINRRQDQLYQRIQQGVRGGGLTQVEADRLRAEFQTIVRLEETYRRSGGGLTVNERADLDRRLDNLSQRIRMERRDGDDRRGPMQITQRIRQLHASIERAIASRWVDRRDGDRLLAESRELRRLEDRYRSGGFTVAERNDLDRRADRLEVMLERESGRQFGYGWGGNYYR